MTRFTGHVFVAIAAILWGSTGIAIFYVLDHGVSRLVAASLTSLLGGIVLIVYSGRRGFKSMHKDLLVYGSTVIVLFRILYVISISVNGAGITASLLYTAPILVALLSPLIIKERASFTDIFLAVIAVVGAYISSNPTLKISSITGFIIGMLLALTYAITIIAVRLFYGRGYSVWEVMAQPTLASIPILLLITLLVNPRIELDVTVFIALLWSGCVCAGLALIIYLKGMKTVKALNASVIATLEPVSAIILASIILGERYSLLQIVGMTMIISSSIAIISRSIRKPLDATL